MNNADSPFYNKFSTRGKKLFEDVASQRVLGASAHIYLISEMIIDLCTEAESHKVAPKTLMTNVHLLAEYFKSTRGEASQAISNAIDQMIHGINDVNDGDLNSFIRFIKNNINDFQRKSRTNLEKINDYALCLLSSMDTIMLFDYSSTVGKMLENRKQELKIFIPESRLLNGGKPYIQNADNENLKFHFIPDAAIFYFLKMCDGAFIGSETFFVDGRVYNTVGSELVALLCRHLQIPFYVLTSFLKIDMRSKHGYQKPPVFVDLEDLFSDIFENDVLKYVDFSCPEIVEIPSKHITAFVTEEGIVPPSSIQELV